MNAHSPPEPLDQIDRKIVAATQAGLPLVERPYAEIAQWLRRSEAEIIARMQCLHQRGVIRRIALAPNHYALGMKANGMSVWDVEDALAVELGEKVGALPFVTHCYLRPRAGEIWPYNLFAMVHGPDRDTVEAKREQIADILGDACRASDILYSTRILKKTGLRLNK
ncbi:MAG: Lrp/AsnC family transcriptional regulator [Paracoccus sp. (in: a-proteobacteria)]|nr:Lrp/AsnC family transcriptional regulator [Paracoccus sp. (in: a-proteobacteria)]